MPRDEELELQTQTPRRATSRTLRQAFLATRQPRVMIVDADAEPRESLASALRRQGYEVTEVLSREELVGHLGAPTQSCHPVALPDLIVADIDLLWDHRQGGPDLVRHLGHADAPVPMILLTTRPAMSGDEFCRVAQLHTAQVFDKSCPTEDLRVAATRLIQLRQTVT